MSALVNSRLLEGSIELFSLPDIYFQVSEMVADPRFSLREIGLVISKDPALSSRLLKIVNSSIYGFQGKVDTISRAIAVIGVEDLNNLVLATSVVDNFSSIPSDIVDMTAYWMHSVNCGMLAKLLAKECSVLNSERLFLSGLLHNIGSLLMYQKYPEQSLQALLAADKDRSKIADCEKHIFGFTHADVSGELIKQWKLPESLYEAVSCYLEPQLAQAHRLDANILALAVRIANAVDQGLDVVEVAQHIDEAGLVLMRIDHEQIVAVSERVSEEFPRVFELIAPNKKFH